MWVTSSSSSLRLCILYQRNQSTMIYFLWPFVPNDPFILTSILFSLEWKIHNEPSFVTVKCVFYNTKYIMQCFSYSFHTTCGTAKRQKEQRRQFERCILKASRTYYVHPTGRQNEQRCLKRVGRLIEVKAFRIMQGINEKAAIQFYQQ